MKTGGYRAADDLTLIFVSPRYTVYYEKGPDDVWPREVEYFCALGRLAGPRRNVEIGLRELSSSAKPTAVPARR